MTSILLPLLMTFVQPIPCKLTRDVVADQLVVTRPNGELLGLFFNGDAGRTIVLTSLRCWATKYTVFVRYTIAK